MTNQPQEQEDWRIRLFKSDIWGVLNAVLTPAESAMLDNFITTEIKRAKAEERERTLGILDEYNLGGHLNGIIKQIKK